MTTIGSCLTLIKFIDVMRWEERFVLNVLLANCINLAGVITAPLLFEFKLVLLSFLSFPESEFQYSKVRIKLVNKLKVKNSRCCGVLLVKS